MVGSKLGPYDIRERLGAGGMGEVYRAHDPRLGREVALKVLRSDIADSADRRDRFQREARLLAALDHPGIVTVHSIEEAEGVRFLTMQLVEGETIDALIPEGGLALDELFAIAVPLAEAVAAAHERGIVHRDLKPANVMRTRDGRVKVLDFGLAKLRETLMTSVDRDAPTDPLTREGIVLGTLPYMAPEQVDGRPADARSDVFALGTVLYEMATGRRPFSGPSPAALVSAILQSTPPDPGELRRGLPRALGRLLHRCLEKDPEKRPANAGVVCAELREASSSAGAPAAAGSTAASMPSSIAVLPFAALSSDRDDEFFADGVAEEIINALGRLPALRVAARTSTFAFKNRHEDLREIGDKLGVETVLEGSVRRAGKRLRIAAQLVSVDSGYQLWSERYDRELDDVFEIQEQIARSIAGRLEATLGGSVSERAEQGRRDVDAFELQARGRGLLAQRTEEAMRRAADCFREATERDPSYALAWSGLGAAIALRVDYYGDADVEAQTLRAERAVERALALAPDLPEAHSTLGLLHYRRRDLPAAIEAHERAVELRPSYAEAYGLLGWFEMLAGRLDAAESRSRRAVELDPLSPEAQSHLPLLSIARGDFDEALRAAEGVVALHPDFSTGTLYEAVVLFHVGDLERCRRRVAGLSVPWAGSAPEWMLAIVDASVGDARSASERASRFDANGESDLAGLVYAVLGDLDGAFAAFERVDRFGYWSTLALRMLLLDELARLREDPRYAALLAAMDRQWGLQPGSGAGGRSAPG